MKQHNPLIWGVISIVMGLLIMIYPDNTLTIMLRIIGIALLCVGVIQIISFFGSSGREGIQWSKIPLGGVLALALGVMLAVSPATFVSFFMILIGLIIICLDYMSGSFSNLLLCCNIQRGTSSQRVALRDAIVDVPFRLHIFLLPKYQCGLGGDICRLLDRGLRNMGDNRILRYLQGIKEITRLAISEAFILVRQA